MRLVPDWPDPYGRPIYGRKQKTPKDHMIPGSFETRLLCSPVVNNGYYIILL